MEPGRCFDASGGTPLVSDAMTPKRETPWKGIAILLAIVLGVVLVAAALVVSGIMDLGFSLL